MRFEFYFRAVLDATDIEGDVHFMIIARNVWDAYRKAANWCDGADISPESLTIEHTHEVL